MKNLVYLNGRLLPEGKAHLSFLDSAYLYGEGAFETLVAFGGRVPFLKHHVVRLYRSAKKLEIPIKIKPARLAEAVYKTLRANHLSNAYLRINLSKREGHFGRKRKTAGIHLVIVARPHAPYPAWLYRRGGKLILVRSTPNDPSSLTSIKSTNYLTKMIARREIAKRGAVEGVLLNAAGRATEGASSSLFIVKKRRLVTPPLSEGLLPGITRQAVLKIARRMKIPVREKPLTISQLKKADEIFVASTLKKILPIGDFEGRRLKAPGPVTRRLTAAYESIL